MPATSISALKIHLLDMGTEKYGDCLLVELGNRRILIDGGHPGDYQRRGDSPGVPEQLEGIMGHPAPFGVDLLVVTHCHSDHIGCLPTIVGSGDLTAKWALVADEKLGFGRALGDEAPDAASSSNRMAALLREEDHTDLQGADFDQFVQDAANLEQRYNGMLSKLVKAGTRLIRYGRDDHSAVETAFRDFGLKVLGPSRDHLVICAEAIARFNGQADALVADISDDANSQQIEDLYRSILAQSDASAEGAEDRPGKGAALNDQSIVIKLQVGNATALLAGDMQFAVPEISKLPPLMKTLRQVVSAAGPYRFIKLTHHSSYNGLDETVLSEWSATRTFAHTGGLNAASHPDPNVLEILEAHTDQLSWARTDRNGLITVTFPQSSAKLGIERGELNDPTPNGDSATAVTNLTAGSVAAQGAGSTSSQPVPALPLSGTKVSSVRSSSGFTEVSATAKLAPDVTRLTVTFDISRVSQPLDRQLDPAPRRARPNLPVPAAQPGAAGALTLANGRSLPSLLFITNSKTLADNIGATESQAVITAIRNAGQTLYDVRNPQDPFTEVRAQLKAKSYKGVVIVGGYDVLPAQRLDVLPPSVRQAVGARTGDADNFIVWNDEVYGDVDGDKLSELPVSRIPDARAPNLVFAAMTADIPRSTPGRFGVRNAARPFAVEPYSILPGSTDLFVSAPTSPDDIGDGRAAAPHVYVMLHGSDMDGTRFWGEDDTGVYEALNVRNVPSDLSGVVFSGCCWGALTVGTTALRATPGPPAPRPSEASMALSWLKAGVRAFVGCTGTHYSPTEAPYGYFGGPMHKAFWTRYTQGEPPAQALFDAKLDYLREIPHGRGTPNGQAIEFKTLKQFTCLGLGW